MEREGVDSGFRKAELGTREGNNGLGSSLSWLCIDWGPFSPFRLDE